MQFGPRLTRAFFARPCAEVARDLVGAVLVRDLPGGERLAIRLVEVEAYLGIGLDPASHAHKGPTQRNRRMFEAPGRLYAYRSYGVHTCVNLVCDAPGVGAAVLLRAGEPLLGLETMRRLRALPPRGAPAAAPRDLRAVASGPGRLAQALGLELDHDGASVLRGAMTVRAPIAAAGSGPWPLAPDQVEAGPRVGITRGTELPYRFVWKDHPLLSPWRPGRAARRS